VKNVAAIEERVLVIPCSGIGKVQGLLSREATYLVVDELAPGETDTLCLALLVKGDSAALEEVRTHKCIAIDGCAKACAQKNVEAAGGQIAKAFQVASVLHDYRGALPGTGSELTEDGWAIARDIAAMVTAEVVCLRDSEGGDR
jgi:uncharacterized metal-binding protein